MNYLINILTANLASKNSIKSFKVHDVSLQFPLFYGSEYLSPHHRQLSCQNLYKRSTVVSESLTNL